MNIDTSAIIAILFNEIDAPTYANAVVRAESCGISAATFVEAGVTEEQAHLARQAFSDFGKGRHPANLNLGDFFTYAFAKESGQTLLFKEKDFSKTDVVAAL